MKRISLVLVLLSLLTVMFPIYALEGAPKEKAAVLVSVEVSLEDVGVLVTRNYDLSENEFVTEKEYLIPTDEEKIVQLYQSELAKANQLSICPIQSGDLPRGYIYDDKDDPSLSVRIYSTVYFTSGTDSNGLATVKVTSATGGYTFLTSDVTVAGHEESVYCIHQLSGPYSQQITNSYSGSTSSWSISTSSWSSILKVGDYYAGCTSVYTLQRPNGYQYTVTLSNNL